MQAKCRCGGQWECTETTDTKVAKPVKCLKCGTTDIGQIAEQVLSVSKDFVGQDHPESPFRTLFADMGEPTPMPLSGPDLTLIGHLAQSIEHAAHALRSAFIDKGMVNSDGERSWDSEWTEAAKKLERDAYNLVRSLEEHARKTGAQLYMLS